MIWGENPLFLETSKMSISSESHVCWTANVLDRSAFKKQNDSRVKDEDVIDDAKMDWLLLDSICSYLFIIVE